MLGERAPPREDVAGRSHAQRPSISLDGGQVRPAHAETALIPSSADPQSDPRSGSHVPLQRALTAITATRSLSSTSLRFMEGMTASSCATARTPELRSRERATRKAIAAVIFTPPLASQSACLESVTCVPPSVPTPDVEYLPRNALQGVKRATARSYNVTETHGMRRSVARNPRRLRVGIALLALCVCALGLVQAGVWRTAPTPACPPIDAGAARTDGDAPRAPRGEILFQLTDDSSVQSISVRICSRGQAQPTLIPTITPRVEGGLWRATDARVAEAIARPGPHVVTITVTDTSGGTSEPSNPLWLP